jgi:hypothetical protein
MSKDYSNDDYIPGVAPGLLLYHIDRGDWAYVVFDKYKLPNRKIGVQWECAPSVSPFWGAARSCLNRNKFHRIWMIAGSKHCPKVPEKYNYEPPNNQGREFCFWHPEVKTKVRHIESLDAAFNYCPECKR